MSEQEASELVNRSWQESLDFLHRYGWRERSPEHIGAFKARLALNIEADSKDLRAELERLREIAECNDPGAVGLRPGEALASVRVRKKR